MILLFTALASATVPDLYGFGPRAMGRGTPGVSMIGDPSAALVNPAGLQRVRRPVVNLGMGAAIADMREVPRLWWDTNRDGQVDDRDQGLDVDVQPPPAIGASLSIGRQIGARVGFGLAVYLPANRLFRLKTVEPDLPAYFMYDNRPQRYDVSAGLGVLVVKGVRLGAAVNVVPLVRLSAGFSLNATVTGADDSGDDVGDLITELGVDVHEVNLDILPGFAPIVGLQLDPGEWTPALAGLRIGASYRHRVPVQVVSDLDIQVNTKVEDVGSLEPYLTSIILSSGFNLYDHYVPSKLLLGASYERGPVLVDANATWTDWSTYPLNVAKISDPVVTAPLFQLDPDQIDDKNDYEATFKSTWSVRGGVEVALPEPKVGPKWRYLRPTLRAGGGWEPSPLVQQGASSAILDGNRWLVTAGAGVETWDPLSLVDGPLRLDGWFQYHQLPKSVLARQAAAPTAGYPMRADGLPIGGSIFVFGASFGFEY
jgi:long-subunit fatty acid transport protein